jgi:formylglycine-generating enzyme required for sulfatase activity
VPDAVTSQKGPNSIQRPESFGKANVLTLGIVGALGLGEERSFEIAPGVKMVFCRIPAGTSPLGSPRAERLALMRKLDLKTEPGWLKAESEEVRGKYTTNGFWLGKFTVTQQEWTALMGSNPSWWKKTTRVGEKTLGMETARFPVENVSWDDAQLFLRKLNARGGIEKVFGKPGRFVLPDEDQWEYACRGGLGNKQPYYWGESLNGDKANVYGQMPFGTAQMGNVLERSEQVGSYAKAAPHPWGLSDMHGNVAQWCENWLDVDHKLRVIRGGSWSEGAEGARAARRSGEPPSQRISTTGFRVCLNPE